MKRLRHADVVDLHATNLGGSGEVLRRGPLAKRFVIPPFSVLDARQGYWQSRKRAWIGLGIRSELGRGDNQTWHEGRNMEDPTLNFYRGEEKRKRGGNDRTDYGTAYSNNFGRDKNERLGQFGPTKLAPGGEGGPRSIYRDKGARYNQKPLGDMFDPDYTGSPGTLHELYKAKEQEGGRLRDHATRTKPALDGGIAAIDRGSKMANRGLPDVQGKGLAEELGRRRGYANATPGGTPRPAASRGKDGKTVRGDGHARPLAATSVSGGPADLGNEYKRPVTAWGGSPVSRQVLERAGGYFDEDGEMRSTATGTSIFDPVVCEAVYRWFTAPGHIVLDPFAGGSVRGIVAAALDRKYVGIDLRPEQTEANFEQKTKIVPDAKLVWLTGDARNVKELVGKAKFDLIFTCPPYFNLELYSYDPNDLSNAADYDEFLSAYRQIIADSLACLRDNRFACYVVGNMRRRDGFYYDLVGDTVRAFCDAGAKLYNEAVLITAVGSLALRINNQFNGSRKMGRTHQSVLFFVKGDPIKAAKALPQVKVEQDDLKRAGLTSK